MLTSKEPPGTSDILIFMTNLPRPVDPEGLPEAVPGLAAQGEPGQLTCRTMTAAEGLLDWLENHGCTGLEATFGAEGITVTWVCPPGLRVVREAGGLCLHKV
jgi:hypothetical protein